MKSLATALGIAFLFVCVSAGAIEQANNNLGKEIFESKCASCHGIGGKGNGVVTPVVMDTPTDLTTLAKRNDGVFPEERVTEVIDGRQEVAAHGPRAMPVWGKEFQLDSPDLPKGDSEQAVELREAAVRNKIKAVVDYLFQLQDMKD